MSNVGNHCRTGASSSSLVNLSFASYLHSVMAWVIEGFSMKSLEHTALFPLVVVVVSTHSLDPCLWGESDYPAFGLADSISLHLASSSINPAGSVHKSRGAVWCVCGCS